MSVKLYIFITTIIFQNLPNARGDRRILYMIQKDIFILIFSNSHKHKTISLFIYYDYLLNFSYTEL